MATVKLHQPVEGKNAGDTVSVSADRAEWLVALGYASRVGDTSDKTKVTAPVASKDPTLAENREAPDEDVPHKDVEPVELSGERTNDDVAAAQAEADKQSEAAKKASEKAAKPVELQSNSEVQAKQAEADKTSEAAAKKGDNALNEPGVAVPVTDPAVPAV